MPETRAERVRQKIERFLVEEKHYPKEEIQVGVEFEVHLDGEVIRPRVDLVVRLGGRRVMVIKCVHGAMEAGERLVVSYGRLLDDYQIPFSVITNWEDARVIDTVSGKTVGSGRQAIPAREELERLEMEFPAYPEERLEREKRILSAYEAINRDLCSAF
ncbi:MAG: type I restriction enzyme HsdR N-terminal domain-containing protein [Euryarchaeota archaeon]|nr:type I restriction enzyme HsdR N-terminal domain-containing protein [Euryarchaeota archaeon]